MSQLGEEEGGADGTRRKEKEKMIALNTNKENDARSEEKGTY